MSLPRIYAGRRRRLLHRLVLNGIGQAMTAFALAQLLRSALDHARSGVLSWPLVAGISASGVVILALRAIEAADSERLGQDYVMRVRLRIFERITQQPLVVGGRRRWGVTMTRLISDLNSLRNWVSDGVARSIVASITIVGLIIALSSFHRAAALAAVGMVALAAGAAAALTPMLRGYVREARKRRGRLANNLGEKVFALQTVRHFGHTDRELHRVRLHSRRLRDALVRRMRAARLIRGFPNAALPLAISTLVVIAATSGYGAADVAVGILLLGMMATALGDLARAWDHRLAFDEGRRRIGEILSGPQLREARDAVDLPVGGPLAVHFDAVRVDGRLAQVTLGAAPGEVVLVCGESGSGKTTLLALAARLLDPDEGRVRIDGIRVDQLAPESLHAGVQLVAQYVPLLRGTVAQNLGYGAEELDPCWLEEVSRACGLYEEREVLPEGIETRVEEQGRNLPDGLRARVALARAAAGAPRLLLVDDPVFSVDPAAKRALHAVLELLDATALVVGPEANPPMQADRVWRLGLRPSSARTATGAELTAVEQGA